MTHAQLELIKSDTNWRLDHQTIKVGRAGVEKARKALAKSHRQRSSQNISSVAA